MADNKPQIVRCDGGTRHPSPRQIGQSNSDEQATMHTSKAEPRYVYVERPRCPECQSVQILAYKTIDGGDGSLSRYTLCRSCHAKFILVME